MSDEYGTDYSKELNPTKRASEDLSSALSDTVDSDEVIIVDERLKQKHQKELENKEVQKRAAEDPEETAPRVKASEALRTEQIIEYASERAAANILFITRDHSIFEVDSRLSQLMREISDMYNELHVLVLSNDTAQEETVRRGENVWLYRTETEHWWLGFWQLRKLAKKQLTFAEGFRPDLIISDDPYHCGLAGLWLSHEYARPFQVRVREDFFDEEFTEQGFRNVCKQFVAKCIIKRSTTVRTSTDFIREKIIAEYPEQTDYTEVMPVYYDLEEWRTSKPVFDAKERFSRYNFIIVHTTSFLPGSNTFMTVNALGYLLNRYLQCGLLIIGDGPEREAVEEHIETLHLSNQIQVLTDVENTLTYLHSAKAFMYTSKIQEDEPALLQAAVLEVPIVARDDGLAGDLFTDGVSALLCPSDSVYCFSEKMNQIVNENAIRLKLKMEAQSTVFNRVSQDYEAYLEDYKASIERSFFSGS